MFIGIDDTDSPDRMCTTYLGAVIADHLSAMGMRVKEARLVRLNPTVPYKTRGNAAVCIEAGFYSGTILDCESVFRLVCSLVEKHSDQSCDNTNPGVVVVDERPAPDFYYRAVRDYCNVDEAVSVLEKAGALYKGYKNRRGLIGATAAVCSELKDYSWELLSYRKQELCGTVRDVSRESVFLSEQITTPHTWDSVDFKDDVVVCVPHTPDPVLYGIRGDSPFAVVRASASIISETPAFSRIYITNQGTDLHLIKGSTGNLKEGRSYFVEGKVDSYPVTGRGGHVSVSVRDNEGLVRCMAYEPTKRFRDVIRALVPGDIVTVAGSYVTGSINLEKICVREVAEDFLERAPLCSLCIKRMTSAGKGKGYKCRKCGARTLFPEIIKNKRLIKKGWYEVPPFARRHLSKPLIRDR